MSNQFKVANLVSRLKIARILTFYTTYLWDLGWDIILESNMARVYNAEGVMASQPRCHTGHGWGMRQFISEFNVRSRGLFGNERR